MGPLAAFWIYGALPLWFLVALALMLIGAVEVVRGIFRRVVGAESWPRSQWHPPGAAAMITGALMVTGPAVAFQRVGDRNFCDADCSVFTDHRRETAWLSFQFSLIAVAVVAVLWALTAWRGWRWMS